MEGVCQPPASKSVETQGAAMGLNDALRSQLGSPGLDLVLLKTRRAAVHLITFFLLLLFL